MLTEKIIKKIKAVLDSDLTAYRIAKEVGYAGANTIHDYRSGKSDIMKMKLSTALEFEKLYKELEEMKKIYIKSEDKTVFLKQELTGIGIGKYWATKIEGAENKNDFGTGVLYTYQEPYVDEEIILNELQEVMKGLNFDIDGNLYELTWTKREGVTDEDLQDLSNFADWEKPYSIELIKNE